MLIAKNKQVGRGNYYNHSGFADPLITGLIGLRPRADNRIVLRPLAARRPWRYFAIDALPYHGHLLTIALGPHRHPLPPRPRPSLAVDGHTSRPPRHLGPLEATLPK